MSFPNIPNITPSINIDTNGAINLLLASIAFEELGLAHIINAEAEKVQTVVGTLPVADVRATSISELLSINESVNRTLQTALKTEMLLQFKLEETLDIPTEPQQPRIEIIENIATVTAFFDGIGVADSDNAFYHRIVT